MARTRNIKPGFFRNAKLCELPIAARMLFAGLWTIADRDGRLEDSPRRIRADVFPFDNFSVSKVHVLLQSLHDSEFIVRYSSGSGNFISIPSWAKHQNPHKKEPESVIPEPAGSGIVSIRAPDESGKILGSAEYFPGKDPDESRKIPGPAVLTTNYLPLTTNHSLLTTNHRPAAGRQQAVAAIDEFPLSLRAIKEFYPSTSDAFAGQIIVATMQAFVGVDSPTFTELTDELMARAVRSARAEASNQKNAGLFKTTVPETVKSWARNGVKGCSGESNPHEINYESWN